MSHSSEPCPSPQGGGRAVPLSEPLWQGAVASAHWLTASATAAVAGRGGMYVCVESDAALLAWLSHSVIRQEPPDLPQEGETSSRSGLESSAIKKKKTKAKGSWEETNKRDIFFWEMLSMFSIKRRKLALSLFPSLSPVLGELHREPAWTDSWTHRTCNQGSYRHPAGHRVHLPLTQKRKSHQGNTGSKAAHKAQTCGRLLNTGQPRQRHRNRKSVTASHTWHELHTGSLFDTTAAAEPQSPATCWPALIEINLHSLIISCGPGLHELQ